MRVLDEPTWQGRRVAHEQRVDRWTAPVLARAGRAIEHPVEDFLFTYYAFRPAQLRRWSPGAGVVLTGTATSPLLQDTRWVAADGGVQMAPPTERTVRTAQWVVALLSRTAQRAPYLGCSGLHEWAMVHRRGAGEVRHPDWPLRLGGDGTAAVVERLPVTCSHWDAYRFFAPGAVDRNTLRPTAGNRLELEQGGCLHTNMDLYKWSYSLAPWVPSELVADSFELALRIRVLDMRASPYDLTDLGYAPIRVETAAGRAEYADGQRAFAAEAALLRQRVLDAAAVLA